MNEHDKELFSKAVEMIRQKRYTSLEINDHIQFLATGNRDVRLLVYEAQKYVREADETAFECAVEAFKQGRSFFDVCKTLEKCGQHPWDSEQMASRAKAKADAEFAQESLDDDLSLLSGKPDGPES